MISSGRALRELEPLKSMSRWTYYAPLWLGTLLAVLIYVAYHRQLPLPALSTGGYVGVGVLLCPLVGLVGQLLMFGAQGAFAQVLPVPGGRSLRGGAAMGVGGLVLASAVLGGVAALLAHESAQTGGGIRAAAIVTGILGVAAGAAALIGYIWGIPAAARDFAEERAGF